METSHVQRKTQKQLWGAAAAAWAQRDEWLDRSSRAMCERMCDLAAIRPGHHVLDLACGTGYPMVTIAERVTSTGKVLATDLAPEMVAAARRKAARLELTHVEFRVMDAERMDLESQSFDAVTCRFGLMFCPYPGGATAEIRRVLKPGGRYAIAVWDEPAKNPFFTTIAEVIAKVAPALLPEPNAPGPFALAAPGTLEAALAAGGLKNPTVEIFATAMEYDSPEDYWATQTELAAPLAAALKALPEAEVARLRAAVLDAVSPRVVDGKVRFEGSVRIASGGC